LPPVVLLIDDSPAIHRLVRARLEGETLELHVASDGNTGIAMAGQLIPDLILLDVDMPSPDGFEVCRRLKDNEATMSVPVVFLTGTSTMTEKLLGLELGALDYVAKPFDPVDLRARVRAALRTSYLVKLLAGKAQIDALTGLWDGRHLRQRLDAELSLARRHGQPVSVIVANIDGLSDVNRQHGIVAGNTILQQTAETFAKLVRTEDILCRHKGDTLAVICPNSTKEGASGLGRRLSDGVAGMALAAHGTDVRVTASFGIATFTPAQSDPRADPLTEALEALARAKSNGGNRIESSQPGQTRRESERDVA
jgi:two-component system, cell cycle response regulator